MSILYNRLEFLEIFDQERIIDEEVEIYEYSLLSNDNIFKLHVNTYDEYSSIMLYPKQNEPSELWIFDIALNNIQAIKIELEASQHGYYPGQKLTYLSFYKNPKENPILRVVIKPTVSLQYHIS